ncbi:MAG: hypothetical protein IPK62_02975 [Bacteroidetes bacterium]|nr:hypothetical protein [Bacteroidota bacterium]MBK8144026.1 hypothetical protein [Bacteroidota bacterium]
MKDLLEKLSSYNIFNYLFPGVVFVILCKYFIGYDFIQENNLLGVFLYYFIGMIISRFGSLFIEPLLIKLKFLVFEDYKKFVTASKIDSKIELFSEINNTYRTISSLFVLLLLIKGYSFLDDKFDFSDSTTYFIVVILLIALFIFSYRKQTNYITKRIKANT